MPETPANKREWTLDKAMWHAWLGALADDPTQTSQNHNKLFAVLRRNLRPRTASPTPPPRVLR